MFREVNMYVIYSIWQDALWASGVARETWRELFFTRKLSRRIWDKTDARSDGISWSFVHKNSSLRFVNIFCTFFYNSFYYAFYAIVCYNDFWHLCLPQFYGVAKKLHSSRLSFTDRGILWTIEPELFDTHTSTRIHITGCKLL